MGDEWREMLFSQAVVVNPSVALRRGTEYPFVDMKALNPGNRCAYATQQRIFRGSGSRFAAGDTLMARITPCLENGKIGRFCADRPAVAHGSTEFIVIRGRDGDSDTNYAYYLTKWESVRDYAIGQMTGTSGRQRVPTESLDHLIVPVPPLCEQRAIAHILGTLDDKIELNRQMSETLEAMARTLFKSWFVHFDPVRAKMEGRWRPGHSLPSLPAHFYELFPARLVPSELGEIPEGWAVKPLDEPIEVNPTRSLRKGDLAPYLDMANMPTKGHTPDVVLERPFGSGMRFINGDTLVARIAPCLENGKTAYVDFLKDSQVGWGSTEYIVLRPKPPLPEQFAYCLARSQQFRDFAIQSMTGSSGRQRVPATALSHFGLALPVSPQVPDAFGHFVKPLFVRATQAAAECRTLAALRDTLLPNLISGELRVKDAERFLKKSRI